MAFVAVALRAEITQEEYASIRVAALKAGVSTQEYVGVLLRRALGGVTERGRLSDDVPPVREPGSSSPRSVTPPEKSVVAKVFENRD